MNIILDKKNTLFYIVSVFILTSPGISYSIFYPYHILIPFLLIFFLSYISRQSFFINKFNLYFIVFFIYIISTGLLLDYYELYFNYIFYSFISITCLMFSFNFLLIKKDVDSVLKMVVLYVFVIIILAFLESVNIVRLPFSPYSQYYSYFGKTIDMSEWTEEVFNYNTQKPTVFTGNPNTFGFLLMVYFPFIFLLKNKIIKSVLLAMVVFSIYKIDSKMIFMTFVFIVFLKFIILNERKLISFLSILFLGFTLYPAFLYLQTQGLLEGRMFNAINELLVGIEYISGNSNVSEMNSTGQRALLYSIGIEKFTENFFLGMGWSGIEGYLTHVMGEKVAFHNFFLMMLVDLGILGFLVFSLFYFYVLKGLYKGMKEYRDTKLGKIYEAFFIGVIASILCSIAPSGIVYLLPYWFFIGISLFMAYRYKEISAYYK
ncbi:O-antigen ligase [Acinetobacter sp. YH12027]|uniref:O-antigen ligase family protein n=1 Tax=Acinetobacter sp. YH12027 TaxID=2601043 RepID=UPI0015D14CCD|nr:oligosaccharide repeat unit polymerase [Acinetobacter sp. YH12027]